MTVRKHIYDCTKTIYVQHDWRGKEGGKTKSENCNTLQISKGVKFTVYYHHFCKNHVSSSANIMGIDPQPGSHFFLNLQFFGFSFPQKEPLPENVPEICSRISFFSLDLSSFQFQMCWPRCFSLTSRSL